MKVQRFLKRYLNPLAPDAYALLLHYKKLLKSWPLQITKCAPLLMKSTPDLLNKILTIHVLKIFLQIFFSQNWILSCSPKLPNFGPISKFKDFQLSEAQFIYYLVIKMSLKNFALCGYVMVNWCHYLWDHRLLLIKGTDFCLYYGCFAILYNFFIHLSSLFMFAFQSCRIMPKIWAIRGRFLRLSRRANSPFA